MWVLRNTHIFDADCCFSFSTNRRKIAEIAFNYYSICYLSATFSPLKISKFKGRRPAVKVDIGNKLTSLLQSFLFFFPFDEIVLILVLVVVLSSSALLKRFQGIKKREKKCWLYRVVVKVSICLKKTVFVKKFDAFFLNCSIILTKQQL